MPALRFCLEPGCRALVSRGRCEAHGGTVDGWRGVSPNRLRGRRLQREREQLFAREPLCRQCREAGRTRLATIRDHIVPLAEGGTDAPTNIQPLCRECSDIKTAAEARRGRQRAS